MKKVTTVGLIAMALMFSLALAAKALNTLPITPGVPEMKVGYFNQEDWGSGLGGGIGYQIPAEHGFMEAQVIYAPLKESETIAGVAMETKVDFFQLSINRLWDLPIGPVEKLTGNVYGGVGIGYGHGDIKVTLSAPCAACLATISDDASAFEGNVIVGYKTPTNLKIEALWIVNESAYFVNVGYLFK